MIVSVKRRALRAPVCQILLFLILLTFVVLLCLRNLHNNEVPLRFTSHSWDRVNTIISKAAAGSLQVEIQSRTAIGEYLWNHLLEGKKELFSDQITYKGNKVMDALNFTFQSGSGENTITSDANIVLVIDVSSQLKQSKEEIWLNDMLLIYPPKSLFLVILGDNACDNNEWLVPYLSSNGGPVKGAFMVWGSFLTDHNEVYQWPLGVATHRHFPLFWAEEIDILSARPFLCNYFGTLAVRPVPHTTHSTIHQLFQELDLESLCYLKMSSNTATIESLGEYIQAVSDSDLTLCPAAEFDGPETHCIYEAFSLGSVPVVENVQGSCGRDSLFLLKKHEAPFILVESLESELREVIANESRMNLQEKIARRARVINWYTEFRHRMASQFFLVINSKLNI